MLLANVAQGSPLITVALILAGSGGLIGVIVALVKLPSDRSNAAVTQAQGAMETMSELNESLVAALSRANALVDFYKTSVERLQARLDRLENLYGPLPPDPPDQRSA